MEDTDNCSRIHVIPQFIGTCWFNAILMTCLFSQGTKEVVYKRLKEIENPNTLIKSFKYIIKKKHDLWLHLPLFFFKDQFITFSSINQKLK